MLLTQFGFRKQFQQILYGQLKNKRDLRYSSQIDRCFCVDLAAFSKHLELLSDRKQRCILQWSVIQIQISRTCCINQAPQNNESLSLSQLSGQKNELQPSEVSTLQNKTANSGWTTLQRRHPFNQTRQSTLNAAQHDPQNVDRSGGTLVISLWRDLFCCCLHGVSSLTCLRWQGFTADTGTKDVQCELAWIALGKRQKEARSRWYERLKHMGAGGWKDI